MQAEAPQDKISLDINPATATAPTINTTAFSLALATAETIAADEFKDGFLFINDGVGAGQMVSLAGNTAVTTGTALDVYLKPQARFTVAPTTACEVGVGKNKYDDIIVRPDSARTSVPLGVTPRAVTANYYFWLQTWGYAPVKTVGTLTVGCPVSDDTCSSTGTAGAVHTMRTTSTGYAPAAGAAHVAQGFEIGNCVIVGASGETSVIDLKISP